MEQENRAILTKGEAPLVKLTGLKRLLRICKIEVLLCPVLKGAIKLRHLNFCAKNHHKGKYIQI